MDRLEPSEARKLIRLILEDGEVIFSGHARRRMAQRGLTEIDCKNVLRGGVVNEPEWEKGTWRYRVVTQKIGVVCGFPSETRLVVISAWRFSK